DVLVKLGLVMFQQRFVAKRPFAVGPPVGVHLQEPKIHAKLDLVPAVLAFEPSDHHLPRLVLPPLQDPRYIEIHNFSMEAVFAQVKQLPSATPARLGDRDIPNWIFPAPWLDAMEATGANCCRSACG